MINDFRQLQALILGPMSEEHRPLRQLIAHSLRNAGVIPVQVEDLINAGDSWRNSILTAIERSDLLVAVITEANPNVMYEVGFAHGRRRRILFIIHNDVKKVPPYIEGYLFLVYDPSNPTGFAQNISAWVARHLPQPVIEA